MQAFFLGAYGTKGAFSLPDTFIRRYADDNDVAEHSQRAQSGDMSGMEKVKGTAGKHDSLAAKRSPETEKLRKGCDHTRGNWGAAVEKETRYLIEPSASALLRWIRERCFDSIEKQLKRQLRLETTDGYVLFFLGVLSASAVVLALSESMAVMVLAGIIAIFRTGDLVSHHLYSMFVDKEKHSSPRRSLLIAALNFIQAATAYGIGFYLVERAVPGSFMFPNNPGKAFRIGEAVYLSFATITTLGAGDVYPLRLAARVLTVMEVLTGLILISFIIGRHMAYYSDDQR